MKFYRASERRLAFLRGVVLIRAILVGVVGLLAGGPMLAEELPVPNIADVTRVDRYTRPSPQDVVTATYILKTNPRPTLGAAYVIE